MTNLRAQKRMVVDVLDAGKSRVWFDLEEQAEIAGVITREDIHELVDKGMIRAKGVKGNSKGRAYERTTKRSYGHREGAGSHKGRPGA